MHAGDLTRSTFDPAHHFSGVRMQQGRVQLDADWNEQVDIQAHRDVEDVVDTVGTAGAPKRDGGFELVLADDGSDLLVSPGRMWVDGRLCEADGEWTAATVADAEVTVASLVLDGRPLAVHEWVELLAEDGTRHRARLTAIDSTERTLTLASPPAAPLTAPVRVRRLVSYGTQPELRRPPHVTAADPSTPAVLDLEDGAYLAHLDVWERAVTALEAPELREQALGGPDTATRTRTTWQIRLLPLEGAPGDLDCTTDLSSLTAAAFAPSTGRMAARAEQTDPTTNNLCTPTPAGGYRGLENQLYRVEVRDETDDGDPIVVWSRDNGSVVTSWTASAGPDLSVGGIGRDAVLGFAAGHWVELLDEGHILAGRPGTLVPVVGAVGTTLTVDEPRATGSIDHDDFADGVAFVRRWDSQGPLTAPVGSWVELEHGVQIRFEPGRFRPGDYWLVPARTASAGLDWPVDPAGRALARPPLGIEHAHAALALVRVDGGGITVADCRRRFPSLTTLTAGDVAFDNGTCTLPGADTVQDALDRLCQARDLRRHHRLLHGWGIVCGLAVHCGPNNTDERRHVTIHPGTAIDAQGNDLDLEDAVTVDLMTKVEELEANAERVLDDNGDGDVCLRLVADAELVAGVAVTKLVPQDDTDAILQGSLLLDVYEDCVKSLHDWLREQLTPPENDRSPAGPARQRLAVLTNLMAQPVNPKAGRSIFLSATEDKILQEFYAGLRERLQSETFCAMFAGARTPPVYPDALQGIDTIFGTGSHTRLRVRPQGLEAYTVGAGSNLLKPTGLINRYDLQAGRLVASIDPIAGKEIEPGRRSEQTDSGSGAVTDVAFSADGRLIYATVPTRSEDDTVFRVGEIAQDTVNWRPPVTICGVKLVTMATTAADPEFVYAIGLRKQTTDEGGKSVVRWHGKGLYRINPAAPDPNLEPLPIPDFFPVGQLAITPEGIAVATAVSGDNPATAYDHLVQIQVPQGVANLPRIPLPASGNDDLALAVIPRGVLGRVAVTVAYTVVGQRRSKLVVGRQVGNGQQVGGDDAVVQESSGAVRLLGIGDQVVVTSADDYDLKLMDARTATVVDGYRLPLQVGPISSGFAPVVRRNNRVYVLNYVSNTISAIDLALLQRDVRFDFEALAEYRKGMLEAYADLLGGFVQYLKDCFFDHFIVRCPPREREEALELACVSIRSRQVYKVCNFSRRRYVKSFPTLEYWLSAVPLLPALKLALSRLACLVLAPTFSKLTVEDDSNAGNRLSVEQLQQLITWAQSNDVLSRLREVRGRTTLTTRAAQLALRQLQPAPPAGARVVGTDLVGQPGEQATELLGSRGVSVRRVPFEAATAAGSLLDVGNLFRQPEAGDEVTLFEDEAGAVRHFAVAKGAAAPSGGPRSATVDLVDRVAALEAELVALRAEIAAPPKAPSTRKRAPKEPGS